MEQSGKALTRKVRGELAEARFIAKALSLGFVVSKPFGDSAKYDFVVESGGRIAKVQIKSSWVADERGRYQINAAPGMLPRTFARRPYRRDEIDFLIAYIAPEEIWLVIPVEVVLARWHFMVRTTREEPFMQYREAWELLNESHLSKTVKDGAPG